MRIVFISVLLSLLWFGASTKYAISGAVQMKINPVLDQQTKKYHPLVELPVGGNKLLSTKAQSLKFLPVFSYKDTIIGDKSTPFGIDCTNKNSCTIHKDSKYKCRYHTFKGNCHRAIFPVQFTPTSTSTDSSLTFAGSSMDNKLDSWIGNFNLLGLNPDSFVWPYLENAYDLKSKEWVEISLVYGLSSSNHVRDRWEFPRLYDSSFLTFNGRKNKDTTTYRLTSFLEGEEDWLASNLKIKDDVLTDKDQQNEDRQIITCFAPLHHTTIGLPSAGVKKLKAKINESLCGNPERCFTFNSDLEKAEPIVIQGKLGEVVSIKPASFLRIKPDKSIEIMIAPIEEFSQDCVGKTSLALGQQVFVDYEFTFRKKIGDRKYEIWFTKIGTPGLLLTKEWQFWAISALRWGAWLLIPIYLWGILFKNQEVEIETNINEEKEFAHWDKPYVFDMEGKGDPDDSQDGSVGGFGDDKNIELSKMTFQSEAQFESETDDDFRF